MKASTVFPKAAKKAGIKYLGMTRTFSNYLTGYFELEDGQIIKTFAYPSIKTVVEAISLNVSEAAYLSNADEIKTYFERG